MKISVCIITFQRPEGLKRLLENLACLTFMKASPPDVEVIVIDNDANPAIRQLCESIATQTAMNLKYNIETQRGISYARNKAVSCVGATTDFIAFIDDDEWPVPSWLDELIDAQHRFCADVVTGPVLPSFNTSVPKWVTEGRFFERPRFSSGHQLEGAATNNVLIRAELLRQMNPVFDDCWALSGGEDWHLFQRLRRAGCRIIWSDEAIVHELIPDSRINLKWILQRSYSHGNTESLCAIKLNPSWTMRLNCTFMGVRRFIRGVLMIPFVLLRAQHHRVKHWKYLFHSVGILAGVVGSRYEEYREVHRV